MAGSRCIIDHLISRCSRCRCFGLSLSMFALGFGQQTGACQMLTNYRCKCHWVRGRDLVKIWLCGAQLTEMWGKLNSFALCYEWGKKNPSHRTKV